VYIRQCSRSNINVSGCFALKVFIIDSHVVIWSERISSPKNVHFVSNYSPSCCSNPVRLLFIFGTQIRFFLLLNMRAGSLLHRLLRNWNLFKSEAFSMQFVHSSTHKHTVPETKLFWKLPGWGFLETVVAVLYCTWWNQRFWLLTSVIHYQ